MMFKVPGDRQDARPAPDGVSRHRGAPRVPVGFQRRQGFGSRPHRRALTLHSTIAARRAIADIKAANAKGTFLGSMAQNYAQPPAIADGLL